MISNNQLLKVRRQGRKPDVSWEIDEKDILVVCKYVWIFVVISLYLVGMQKDGNFRIERVFFVEALFIYEVMKYLNGLWSCQLPTHMRGLHFVILVFVWEWDQFNIEMSITFTSFALRECRSR